MQDASVILQKIFHPIVFSGFLTICAYSWWIWAVVGFLLATSYYSTGARAGNGVAIGAAFGQSLIALLSLHYGRGTWVPRDLIFVLGVILALGIWYIQRNPLVPHLLTVIMDLQGWLPTFIKTLRNPESENLPAWLLWFSAALIAVFSLGTWSVAEWTFPLYITVSDGVIVAILFWHRYQRIATPTKNSVAMNV
jgi:hypothetical protein